MSWIKETVTTNIDSSISIEQGFSVALNSSNVPFIVYSKTTASPAGIVYITSGDGGGGWTTPVVIDTFSNRPSAYIYASIKIDSNDIIHIIYTKYYSAGKYSVKYIKSDGIGGFNPIITIASDIYIGGNGESIDLSVTSAGIPHAVWKRDYSYGIPSSIGYAKGDGVSGFDGPTYITDELGNSEPGDEPSIALDTSGNPHVAYYENNTTSLKYIANYGSGWTTPEELDAVLDSCGRFVDINIDQNNNIHLAYYNYISSTQENLRYLKGTVGGSFDLPTTLVYSAKQNNNRQNLCITSDIDNVPHITFSSDEQSASFRYIKGDGGGGFLDPELIDVGFSQILWSGIEIETSGNFHIVYSKSPYLKHITGSTTKTLIGTGEIEIPLFEVSNYSEVIYSSITELTASDQVIEKWAYDLDKDTITNGEVFNEDAINISLENILSTLKGERLFSPTFGTILQLVTFETIDKNSARQLLTILLRAIKRYEKRVDVINGEIKLNIKSSDNTLEISIPYIIKRTGLVGTFSRKVVI